jgi:hypothetical protein
MSRHTEAVRRLTEIRDVVTSLVAGEADRGSLEDEVARIVTSSAVADGQPSRQGNGRSSGSAEGRHASGNGQPEGAPVLSTAQRPGQPGASSQSGAQPIGRSSHLPGGPGSQPAPTKGYAGGPTGARIATATGTGPDSEDRTDGLNVVKD